MKNQTARRPGRTTRNVLYSLFTIHYSLLLLSSCAEMFQPKVPLSGENTSLDGMFKPREIIGRLAAPAQFYVSPYYSATEIRLAWEAVPGAAYYMVERAVSVPEQQESGPPVWKEPDEGEYEILDRFVYSASFDDTVLKSATLDAPEYQNRYFYRVSAYNTEKKYEESEPCEPQFAMLFRTTEGLKASGGTSVDYVELRWERTAGAGSYEIWRSEFPNGASAGLLGTVPGNQTWFQNRVSAVEQGRDYYYMITAQNGFGNKTLQTRPAYGYARVYGAPDEPKWVRLKDNSGRGHDTNKIEIEWEEVLDAEYYAVYRYSSVDSSLTRLTEETKNTQWSDTVGLKPGVYYYYKVQAIVDDIKSGKSLKSQFSDSDPEGFVLSAPDTVIAEKNPDDGTVTVKWLPAIGTQTEREQYTYKVYRDAGMDGVFSDCIAPGVPYSDIDGEGYIHVKGLPVDKPFFRVSTVNRADRESGMSIVVSPAPGAAIIVDASRYARIDNETANSSGVYPVKITWKRPADEYPAFYHIQRSTRTGTGFTRINETALNADGPFNDVYSYNDQSQEYTYIDRNDTARTGRKYYYRILSLNQLEQGNFPSDEKIGWGALTHTQYMLEYNKTIMSSHKKLTYMNKPGSTEKLGTETKYGSINGSIYYNAAISGLGARIIMRYENYADFYIENEPANGVYFSVTGNTNTSADMSSNGSMDGTVTCTGMYPGTVKYDGIQIKGGAAGGGNYVIQPDGFPGENVSWTVGEQ